MPELSPQAPVRLLVFDLDGTLVDSRRDLANSVNATLEHFGADPLPDHQIATYIGDGASALLQRSLDASANGHRPSLDVALEFFLGYYREHKLDFTYVYPGVLDALNSVRAAAPELPMAVLTNKPVRPSRAICEALGLAPFFFQVIGGDSLPTKKPAPEGLLSIMEESSLIIGKAVSASETVLVGDSHVDVRTARSAGVRCLGCSYGLDPDGLRAHSPEWIVDAAGEWVPILQPLLR